MSAPRLRRLAVAALATAMLAGCAHFVVLNDALKASEHNDLGVAYEANGRFDLAAHEYHHALRLEPHNSRTRVNLGNVQAARGQWRPAEKSFRRALQDSSTNLDAMNNLAIALLHRGRPGEALPLAERAAAAGG